MPVRLKCSCGKVLSVRSEMAGKAVKCPGCSQPIRVPAANPTPPAPAKSELDDLFAEEGFDRQVDAACPACGVEMKAGSILCTKCGFNKQTGERLEGHKTPGVDIDMGTIALQEAADSMARDKNVQDTMHSKAGMPWWMLLVVLFVVGSGSALAVLTVNAANREDETLNFSPMKTFLAGTGGLFVVLGLMAYIAVIVSAFKTTTKQGWFTLLAPVYMPVFAFKERARGNLKNFILAMMAFAIGGFLFYRADRYVPGKASTSSSGNYVVSD